MGTILGVFNRSRLGILKLVYSRVDTTNTGPPSSSSAGSTSAGPSTSTAPSTAHAVPFRTKSCHVLAVSLQVLAGGTTRWNNYSMHAHITAECLLQEPPFMILHGGSEYISLHMNEMGIHALEHMTLQTHRMASEPTS